MKKVTSRERTFRAVRIDKPAIEAILREVLNEIDNADFSLSVEKDKTSYEFTSLSDFAACRDLPDFLDNLSVRITEQSHDENFKRREGYLAKLFHLRGASYAGLRIDATSQNEAWTAGIVDTVASRVAPYSRWYGWLTGSMIAGLGGGMLAAGFMGAVYSLATKLHNATFAFALLALFGLIATSKTDRIFPPFRLIIRETESRLKKYQAEVVVVFTVVAALAAVAQLFVSMFQASAPKA